LYLKSKKAHCPTASSKWEELKITDAFALEKE